MFFKTIDFMISNISSFNLSWDKNVGNSGKRPFHALSFRITGDAQIATESGNIRAGDGDIVFFPAYHNYYLTSGAERLMVIHFNTDIPISDTIKKFSPRNPAKYSQYFEKCADVYAKKELGFEYECKSLLYMILANIERESRSQETGDGDSEIQKAVKYIHRNFTQKNICIHELAAICSMSETYFRKRFAKIYGCSPLAYINTLRAEYAVEMLKTKYYTVSEVSEKCGFSTPYYFSNFIKKKTGHSPKEFIK